MVTPSTPPEPNRSRSHRSVVFALLALGWMSTIFWVSSGPVAPIVSDQFLDLVAKKAGHVVAYALLATLWWLALQDRVTPRVALLAAFAVATCYAGFDEVHQAFTATRDPSALDVGVDAIGAAMGLWVVARWVVSLRKAHPKPE
jgi:VanZ family protein